MRRDAQEGLRESLPQVLGLSRTAQPHSRRCRSERLRSSSHAALDRDPAGESRFLRAGIRRWMVDALIVESERPKYRAVAREMGDQARAERCFAARLQMCPEGDA